MSAALNLAALLAHPRTGGVRVIAAGVDPQWVDVESALTVADLRTASRPALAILLTAPPPARWQQDAVIRRVHDRGYTGLALPDGDTLGEGSVALAARLGLLVLHADDPLRLVRACWQLAEARDALALGYVRHIAQVNEYHARELLDQLQHLAAGVGHGVALVNAERVLACAGGTLPEPVRAAIDFGRWVDTVSLPEGAAASVTVDSPARPGLRLVLFDTGLNPAQLSALAVAVEVAMPAVAARIMIDEVADVNDAAVAAGLLRDLIETRATDPDLLRRMADRGWETSGFHLGFRMVGRTRVDTFALLRSVTGELAGQPGTFRTAVSGSGLTGWASFAGHPEPGEVERVVGMFRAMHTATRRSFNVATGVGAVQSGPAGLVATIDEATDAARIAASRSAAGWFVRIDTLGLEQLLLSWTENDTFVPAATSLLAPLIDQAPELLHTLTGYLDHESSIAATAEAIGIHRNTVSTRIARIHELLGVDLSDADARLAVHLACRAIQRNETR